MHDIFLEHMRSALFLGAGASCFVSHPTTKELLNMVKKNIQNSNISEHGKGFILEFLRSESELDDIEKVYDCINHVLDGRNHYSRYILNNMTYVRNGVGINYPDMVDALEETKMVIRDVLLDSFNIESSNIRKIKAVYNEIWSVMQTRGSSAFQIITTNYDQVIERYCDADWELVNGFHFAPNLQPNYWNNNWRPSTDKQSLHLVKLHGSITWQRDEGRIRQADVPGIRNSDNDIMIMPTLGSKDYKKSPFNELKEQFEKILNNIDVLVVIGFSYRDPEINEMINKRVKDGMVVISISPEPDQVREISGHDGQSVKIRGMGFSRFGPRMFAYKKKFDLDTLNDICNAIKIIYQKLPIIRNSA